MIGSASKPCPALKNHWLQRATPKAFATASNEVPHTASVATTGASCYPCCKLTRVSSHASLATLDPAWRPAVRHLSRLAVGGPWQLRLQTLRQWWEPQRCVQETWGKRVGGVQYGVNWGLQCFGEGGSRGQNKRVVYSKVRGRRRRPSQKGVRRIPSLRARPFHPAGRS